jgi:hypothetical protein
MALEVFELALIADSVSPYPSSEASGFPFGEVAFEDVTSCNAYIKKPSHTMWLVLTVLEYILFTFIISL